MVNEYVEPKSALSALRAVLLLTGVDVSTNVPSTIPSTGFIRIARAGGSMPNLVTDQALMIIQVYAPNNQLAEQIMNKCRGRLRQAQGTEQSGVWVRYWREVGGPAEYGDPDVQGFVRWQMSGQLATSTK